MSILETERLRLQLEISLNKIVQALGKIKVGDSKQFPYGWRKAAKGRTVWRILEEAITQNLEYSHKSLGFEYLSAAESEVGVYDFSGKMKGIESDFYVNIKSAVIGARANKDDISKADKLLEFFESDQERKLFIASFLIQFDDDMSVTVREAIVMPTTWIPDIYVNPSNNGNLQSSKYKSLDDAVRRENAEFINELREQINVAQSKKAMKVKRT